MKEMKYQAERKREVLWTGVINDHLCAILNLGTHPTAYVKVNDDEPFFGVGYDDLPDELFGSVHGGITYAENNLPGDTEDQFPKGWWLGWDYAHCDDYLGYYTPKDAYLYGHGKRWTTAEILSDVIDFVDTLSRHGDWKPVRPIDANKLGQMKSQFDDDYHRGWNDAIDAIMDEAPTIAED
jgi:hypothetical protein